MATLAQPQSFMFDAFGSSQTVAGESVSVEGAIAIADVFAAVNLVSEEVGKLPLKIYRDLGLSPSNPGTGTIEAPEHRAYRMLHDMPNPHIPAMRFWSTITGHQLLWGNWFLEKLRGSEGLVEELRICRPDSTVVYWNEVSGAKQFLVTRQSGDQVWLSEDQIIHGFGYSTDGVIGLSPIQQSREALGVVKARERFEGEAYGQHPYASAVMEHPGTVKDPKRIRESWRAIYGTGSVDRGGIAVLEEGATLKEMTMPMQDLQFVESARLSKTQIANIFKLPPSYIGGSVGDSLTYQTVESNKIWLATQCLAPVAQNIAQFLSRDPSLFPFQSWYCDFDMSALLRGDSKARADYYAAMFALKDGEGKRALAVDEIREAENLPPAVKEKAAPIPAPLLPTANGGNGATTDASSIIGANG